MSIARKKKGMWGYRGDRGIKRSLQEDRKERQERHLEISYKEKIQKNKEIFLFSLRSSRSFCEKRNRVHTRFF
jgi:hypothetical protein